jgi:hypothetical protein
VGNLTAAFKKTGIFPFNPKAVDREGVASAIIYRNLTLMIMLMMGNNGCSVVEVKITADFWIQPICEV